MFRSHVRGIGGVSAKQSCSPTTRRTRCSIRPRSHQDRQALGVRPGMARFGTGPIRRPRFISIARPQGRAARRASSHVQRRGADRWLSRLRTARCRYQARGLLAHARRKFYEVQQATASPIAAEALRRIAELYAIETAIRSQTARPPIGGPGKVGKKRGAGPTLPGLHQAATCPGVVMQTPGGALVVGPARRFPPIAPGHQGKSSCWGPRALKAGTAGRRERNHYVRATKSA